MKPSIVRQPSGRVRSAVSPQRRNYAGERLSESGTLSGKPDALREPNALLRARMQAMGLTVLALSRKSGIDQRTIERWLGGERSPQRANAEAVALRLNCAIHELWPDQFPAPRPIAPGTVEADLYQSRAHVPVHLWLGLFGDAHEQIDICVYGGTFLFDTVPGFLALARSAVHRGAILRFIAGDPASHAVAERGREERIEHSLSERCRMTLRRLEPIADEPNVDIRVHSTTLYASMFRADTTMVVNPHAYGAPASDNPAFVIRRDTGEAVWETYAASFERIWSTSRHYQF